MNTKGTGPHCSQCEYIFDIFFPYDRADSLHLWTKTVDGTTKYYELLYHPRIYVTADVTYPSLQHEIQENNVDEETLALHFFYRRKFERSMEQIYLDLKTLPSVVSIKRVKRFFDSFHDEPGDVWEVRLLSYAQQHFDETIRLLRSYAYKIFNCDINKRQHFFLDVEATPMTAVHIETGAPGWICGDHQFSSSGNGVELVRVQQMEDITQLEYYIPEFTMLDISIEINLRNTFPDKHDSIKSIEYKLSKLYGQQRQIEKGNNGGRSPFELIKEERLTGRETQILIELNQLIRKFDPDIINIDQGDRFYLNYLAQRAKFNAVHLVMDRLNRPLYPKKEQSGQTYMTYGQLMRRDPVRYLPGRVFLDKHNSFNLEESGIPGMIEMSRISGLPPVRTSRSSIGSTLTGVEFHINRQTTPPTLVPVAKSKGEQFKNAHQLLIADNGGLIYPAQPGVFDRVWTIDFTSLYPFIMLNHNLGSETVLCEHQNCADPEKNPILVDELNYHICKQRVGVVAKTMELVLNKRTRMKEIKKSNIVSSTYQEMVKGIDSAYKWILVSCLDKGTKILTKKNGILAYEQIDEAVRNFNPDKEMYILGMDEFGNSDFKLVRDVIKKRTNTQVYEIHIQGKTPVTATTDHLWPILTSTGWTTLRTDQLTTENYLPVLTQFSTDSLLQRVSLVDELYNILEGSQTIKWRISGEAVKNSINQNYEIISQVANKDGYIVQTINNWKKSGLIPIKYWPLIRQDTCIEEVLVGSGKIKGGLIQWINSDIPLDNKLGFFLGYLLGDGTIGHTIRLAVNGDDQVLLAELCDVIESLWSLTAKVYKEKKANMYVVQINSRALCFILNRVFGIADTAKKGKLKIPEVVWNGPEEIARGFLVGLLAADGSVGTNRYNVKFHTADKTFQEDIGFLCTKLGLFYNMYTKKTGKFEYHAIVLRDHRSVEKLKSFGFIKLSHKERLEKHRIKGHVSNRYNEWPVHSTGILNLARKARKTREPRITQRAMISKVSLQEKVLQIKSADKNWTRKEFKQLNLLDILSESSLTFRKITHIEPLVNPPDYVYCFQLDSPTPWFLVQGSVITHNCFGYLGFKNARWGSIEAHQAVTAYGRRYLLQARLICEEFGFEVIAGITDSLFIRSKTKTIDTWEAVQQLANEITKRTGVPMDVEGKFQWVVFSSIKESENVAALNRYYGMFTDGEFKLRGIKHRQRRAFTLEKQFTEDVLEKMAVARCVEDFTRVIPETYAVLQHYITRLQKRMVSPFDLITKLKSTRGSGNYRAKSTLQAIATKRYAELGNPVEPGESFFFVVVDDSRKRSIDRVRIGDEIAKDTPYDISYYIDQINRDYLELTIEIQRQVFGKLKYDKEGVRVDMREFWEDLAEPDTQCISLATEAFEGMKDDSHGDQEDISDSKSKRKEKQHQLNAFFEDKGVSGIS